MKPGSIGFVSLRRRLLVLGFADEFGPLYALYTLLFDNHGISTAQISNVFVLWAAVAIVLEVPSGALADRFDRRKVVAAGLVARALGITVWLVWPTYAGVVLGASLWALHNALASGAWEAMIYDELAASGQSDRYGPLMARVGQATQVGTASSAFVATAMLSAGLSLHVLGWVTVAVHAVTIPLLLSLPVAPVAEPPDGESHFAAWWSTLRAGLQSALRVPAIGRMVLLGALLEGLFIFDEYVPLVGRERGASDGLVPLFVVAVWGGLFIGGEIAARQPRSSPLALGVLLCLGALAAGAAFTWPWAPAVALVGLTYLTMNVAWITAEARMQDVLEARVRATVSSVRAVLGGLLSAAVFVVVGATAGDGSPAPALAGFSSLLLVIAILLARWLPLAPSSNEDEERHRSSPSPR